jgi:hypothetical protein
MDFSEFIERLLAARGMTRQKIAPHIYEELFDEVKGRLEESVNAEMISVLASEDIGKLEGLLNTSETTQDQLQTFFTDRIPDFELRLARVLLAFHNLFLSEPIAS